MFRHCNKLRGFRFGATDGEIGKVQDFYFDDQNWTVRYVVADTGYWLPDRLVLIAPHALQEVDEKEKVVHAKLTRQQIEESPPITSEQPVSRQFEREYYRYYGWPVYWSGPALWGPGPYPLYYPPPIPEEPPAEDLPAESGDPNLRSVREMTGYHIRAQDGELGHVEDVIIEDRGWAIRYLVVDTRNWLPGKRVLIAPPWIERIDWETASVAVDLERKRIETAPEYHPDSPMTRAYEIELFQHYSREGYWPGEAAA